MRTPKNHSALLKAKLQQALDEVKEKTSLLLSGFCPVSK